MDMALPYDFLNFVEKEYGKEKAAEFSNIYEKTVNSFEIKAIDLALQKKLELKDELTKELATKADLQILKADLQIVKAELRDEFHLEFAKLSARIDKLEIKLNFLIILMIIALTLMNPVVAKLISNWLKLGL